jgi:hypothetical protein
MPTRPKVEQHPADVIGNAVKAPYIGTGDEAEYFGY